MLSRVSDTNFEGNTTTLKLDLGNTRNCSQMPRKSSYYHRWNEKSAMSSSYEWKRGNHSRLREKSNSLT